MSDQDYSASGGWNTIESDAGVFTYLLENLGVKDVQFEELISLDPSALAELYPVYGVIFLFKYPTDTPYTAEKPLDGSFDHVAAERLWFARQTIQNACGTQALLSVVMNKDEPEAGPPGTIDIGPQLGEFKEFTMALPPEFRGEALSNSELIRQSHNSFARSDPFADEAPRQSSEAQDAFHFIAYTAARGRLYELDGLQPAPISHGECSAAQFPERVMEVLQRRIARYDAAEIRFNLLAVVRDLRARAREFADAEALAREERKRKEWEFENALRRYNFVGFTGEMLKGVVKAKLAEGGEAAYDEWIKEGAEKMGARAAERRRMAGGGGEDVQMGG